MRGDRVYRVYGVHEGREKDGYFGTFRTIAEASAEIEKLKTRVMHGRNWAEQYHNKGFVTREAVVDTDFEIPPRPTPREKYLVKTTAKPNGPGTWDSTLVEVCRRNPSGGEGEHVCRYERNNRMLQTFDPFRQGSREFALISRDYAKTAVLDLASGEVIAEEEEERPGSGFCPVGFYVPDWWDVNDGSMIPGSEYWSVDKEWPTGDFGFLWGCHWGDDRSWKVQYLDLSRVQSGIIQRDDRFGYVELATDGYCSPCFDVDGSEQGTSPSFIRVQKHRGIAGVTFAVEMQYSLATGKPQGWRAEIT